MTTELDEYRTERDWEQWRKNYKQGDEVPDGYVEYVRKVIIPKAEQVRQQIRSDVEKLL